MFLNFAFSYMKIEYASRAIYCTLKKKFTYYKLINSLEVTVCYNIYC